MYFTYDKKKIKSLYLFFFFTETNERTYLTAVGSPVRESVFGVAVSVR